MSYAVQHNLPIFSKDRVIEYNDKYYISATIGSESYLGFMKTSPRKDYFALIDINRNGRFEGSYRIGRLDTMDVSRKVKKSWKILVEVIPNKYGNFSDFSEYVPKMRSGYLEFNAADELKTT
jgi:hypothetical protein